MPDLPGWAWGLIGLAAVAVVWFAWRWFTPASSSLRKALAQHLDAKAEHVYVNLPPRPQRYPGALFSRDYGHIYRFAGAEDPDLTKGAETQFQHDIDALGDLHGGASAAVFQVLAKASDSLRVELTVSKCRVVEMTVSALAERIAAYRKVHPALPEDLRVIVRGLEGVFRSPQTGVGDGRAGSS